MQRVDPAQLKIELVELTRRKCTPQGLAGVGRKARRRVLHGNSVLAHQARKRLHFEVLHHAAEHRHDTHFVLSDGSDFIGAAGHLELSPSRQQWKNLFHEKLQSMWFRTVMCRAEK